MQGHQSLAQNKTKNISLRNKSAYVVHNSGHSWHSNIIYILNWLRQSLKLNNSLPSQILEVGMPAFLALLCFCFDIQPPIWEQHMWISTNQNNIFYIFQWYLGEILLLHPYKTRLYTYQNDFVCQILSQMFFIMDF